MIPRSNEPRIMYLARVLHKLMDTTPAGQESIWYDEAYCDGLCLADDILAEVESLINEAGTDPDNARK